MPTAETVKVELNEIIALDQTNVMGTYARRPVVFVRGEGARLWDSEGHEYLDFLAGIAVCSENRKIDRGGAAGQHSRRYRRADRTIGAALLPEARIAVHDQLSHAFPGIHLRTLADSRKLDLGGAARLPWRQPGGDGGDAGAGERTSRP